MKGYSITHHTSPETEAHIFIKRRYIYNEIVQTLEAATYRLLWVIGILYGRKHGSICQIQREWYNLFTPNLASTRPTETVREDAISWRFQVYMIWLKIYLVYKCFLSWYKDCSMFCAFFIYEFNAFHEIAAWYLNDYLYDIPLDLVNCRNTFIH